MSLMIKAALYSFLTFLSISAFSSPVIVVNPDIVSSVGKSIFLDATESHDTNSSELKFNWTILSSPEYSMNHIEKSNTNVATLTLDKIGRYTILLSVENTEGEVSEQIVSISSFINYDEIVYGPLSVEIQESCILRKGFKSLCEVKEYNFPIVDTDSTYTLIAESKGVSTALISINGIQVSTYDSFGKGNTFSYKQIKLEDANTMTIKLGGRISESLEVMIVKNIDIIPNNNPPVISVQDIIFSGNLGGESTIFSSDPDGDNVSFSVVEQPLYGKVDIVGSKVFYVPDRSSSRDDSFIISANDSGFPSKSVTQKVGVNFLNGNIPPLVSSPMSVSHGEPLSVLLAIEDNFGQYHRGEVVDSPANGSAIIYGTNYSDKVQINYVPNPDFVGDDSFIVRVFDDGSPALYTDHVVNLSVLTNNLPYINFFSSIETAQGVSAVEILHIVDINELQDVTVSANVDPRFGSVSYDYDTQRLSVFPNEDFFGDEKIEIILSDNASNPGINTYFMDVHVRENETPIPVIRDVNEINPGMTKDFTFFFRDENSNQSHTYELIGEAKQGRIELLPELFTIRYSADSDFDGDERFTLAITDNGYPSKTGLYDFIIRAKYNQPPNPTFSINNPHLSFPVNANIILRSGDLDGDDSVTYSIIEFPEHGTATLNPFSSRVIDYSPEEGFSGVDYVTVRVMDDGSPPLFKDLTIPINVYDNTAPEVIDTSYDISEGGTTTLYIRKNDIDRHQSFTYEIVSGPTLGSVTFSNTHVIEYQANAGAIGTDYITVKVTDNGSPSLSGIGIISVNIVENRSPTIEDITTSVSKGLSKRIYPRGRDLDTGQQLTYSVAVPPSNGIATFKDQYSYVTYLPNPGFVGLDEFEVLVSDNGIPSKTARAIVSVTVEEEDPVDASISDIRTLQGVRYGGYINITDDNADNTFKVDFSVYPIGGIADLLRNYTSSSKKRYFSVIPRRDFYGSDLIGFNVEESNSISRFSKNVFANITVERNNAPAPYINDSIETIQGKAKVIKIFHNDIDVEEFSQNISYKIVRQPYNGNITLGQRSREGIEVTYTPALNFFGDDTFIVAVSDDGLALYETEFEVPVSVYENSSPTAVIQNLQLTTGSIMTAFVEASDIDSSQVLSYSIIENGKLGIASISNDGVVEYQAGNQAGDDIVRIRISDNGLPQKFIDIPLNVSIIENTPPVLSSLPINTFQGQAGTTLINVSDPDDGQSFMFSISSPATKGSVSINHDGLAVYTPSLGSTGIDSFIVNVKDSGIPIGSTNLTVNVNITANSTPVLTSVPSTISIFQSGEANVQIAFSDEDTFQDHSFVILSHTSLGSTTLDESGSLKFVASNGVSGIGEIRVGVQDNAIPPAVGEVIIPVEVEKNSDPVITAADFETFQSTSYVGSFSVSDANSWQELSVNIKSQPISGHVVIDFNTRKFSYTPDVGFSGMDTFILEVSDTAIPSGLGQQIVNVNVIGNTNPTITADSFTTFQSTSYTAHYETFDIDEWQDLNVIIKENVRSGTLVLDSDTKSFTYAPWSGFSGEDSFTLQVRDSAVPSGTYDVIVGIVVTPNTIPIIGETEFSVLQRSSSNKKTVLFTDPDDSQMHTFGIQRSPSKGYVEISDSGELTYTPYISAQGSDSFKIFVSDNAEPSGTAYADVTVNILDNEAPTIMGATSIDVSVGETVNLTYFASDSNQYNSFTFYTNSLTLYGDSSIDPLSGDFTYISHEKGTETISVNVIDNGVPEMSTELLLTVNSHEVNHSPILSGDDITVLTGEYGSTKVEVEDLNVDQEHSFSIITPPQNGDATISPEGDILYKSNEDFSGEDFILVRVEDNGTPVKKSDIIISISVNENTPPSPVALNLNVVEGMSFSHLIITNDPDLSQSHTYEVLTYPSSGVLSIDTEGKLSFLAPYPFSGELTAMIRVVDDGLPAKYGDFTVIFNVLENFPPTIITDTFSVNKNSSISYPVEYEDLNTNQEHTLEIIGLPSHGTISLNSNLLTYTPDADFFGQDSVSVKIIDNGVPAKEGQKTITINVLDSTNSPPSIGGVFYDIVRSNYPFNTEFFIEDVSDDGEVVSFEWNFGDGTPIYKVRASDRISDDIRHTYLQTGDYTVSVKAIDDEGAEFVYSFNISIVNTEIPVSKPIITTNLYSVGDVMSLDGSQSYDVDGDIVTYLWAIRNEEADIEDFIESVSLTYSLEEEGEYEVCLYVLDENRAIDSSCQNVYVDIDAQSSRPYAKIRSSSSFGNSPLEITFSGADSYSEGHAIESYFWRVNEADVFTYYEGETFSHIFKANGTHSIFLTVVDDRGYSSEIDYDVYIGADETLALGLEVEYSGGYSYDISVIPYSGLFDKYKTILTINNERLHTSSDHYTFPNEGTYTIEAEVYDFQGIKHVLSKTIYVGDSGPYVYASVSDTEPEVAQTVDIDLSLSNFEGQAQFYIEFGDGTSLLTANSFVSHAYTELGRKEIRISLTDDSGVTNKYHTSVNVSLGNPPHADVLLSTDSGNSPLLVNASSVSTDFDGSIVEEKWILNGPNLSTFIFHDSSITLELYDSGVYVLELFVTDDSNNTSSTKRIITVEPYAGGNNIPIYSADRWHWDSSLPILAGFEIIYDESFDVTKAVWNFGDGTDDLVLNANSSGNLPDVEHIFSSIGTFNITVLLEDDLGNSGSYSFDHLVQETEAPVSIINASATSGAFPVVINFDGSSSYDLDGSIISYFWDIEDYFDDNGESVSVSFEEEGTYIMNLYVLDDLYTIGHSQVEIEITDNFVEIHERSINKLIKHKIKKNTPKVYKVR